MPANFSSTPLLDDSTVLELTRNGERELREPGTTLEPGRLEALVLIDGTTTVAQLLRHAKSTPPEALRSSLQELLSKGYLRIAEIDRDMLLNASDFFSIGTTPAGTAEAGEQANAQATADTELLQRNGYCVNLARPRSPKRKDFEARKPTVLVIDDDPDICSLLQLYLKLEGFETRIAGNREEILAELRTPPLPDLVLLDVWMPDVNGFDILAKLRQHPILKELPVIMLTAEATREAVLKGMLGGADGYITKPFQIHPLVRAVKTVLGMKVDSGGQDWDYSL